MDRKGIERPKPLQFIFEVSIRKPDLAVILHANPVVPHPSDRSFQGVCDLCIEFLSDSTPAEVERDTVHKKEEYAEAGVAEYYILDRLHKHTAFYFLNQQGGYERMKHQEPGVIHSRVKDCYELFSGMIFIKDREG